MAIVLRLPFNAKSVNLKHGYKNELKQKTYRLQQPAGLIGQESSLGKAHAFS